ncbi:MAG: hypothetical protein MUC60_17480 [Oscillatoria sp. Prado101]|jgi:hypothetical protein|nr:hypothetical protein [Oscillatoria sp. Prado101]
MEGSFDRYGFEHVQLDSLKDLDLLIAERFELPERPYSKDIRAALEIVIWALENTDSPYFAMFRGEKEALPGNPFGVGFERQVWGYATTAPLAICKQALYEIKRVEITLLVSE